MLAVNVHSLLFVLIGGLCMLVVTSVTPKRYELNLDLAPEERWNQVAVEYTSQMQEVIYAIYKRFHVSNQSIELVTILADNLEDYLPTETAREIEGLAVATGIPLGELLVYNFLNELTAYCTSIVVENEKGVITHGRNLDFGLTDKLKDSVIIVDVKRNGKLVCTGVTYAGYVGFFTGVKQNGFSVSANDRTSGTLLENILELLLNRKAKFVGLVMRGLLESDNVGYTEALKELQTLELIAPCYIILGGVAAGEGAVITRGREMAVDTRFIDTKDKIWYVLETNFDWWNAPGDNRRQAAVRALDSVGRANMTGDGLYEVLSSPFVCNNQTTFTAIMSAAEPEAFHVSIREGDTKCE